MHTEEILSLAAEKVHYIPETGEFISCRTGLNHSQEINYKGYIRLPIRVNKKRKWIKAHRLAMYIMHNIIPESIDHINMVKHDNRIDNLRTCTVAENNRYYRESLKGSL